LNTPAAALPARGSALIRLLPNHAAMVIDCVAV